MNIDLTGTLSDDDDHIEVITLFKGKSEATYLLDDFEKYGEDATPIRQRLHPTTKDAPFAKFYLGDIDGIAVHKEGSAS